MFLPLLSFLPQLEFVKKSLIWCPIAIASSFTFFFCCTFVPLVCCFRPCSKGALFVARGTTERQTQCRNTISRTTDARRFPNKKKSPCRFCDFLFQTQTHGWENVFGWGACPLCCVCARGRVAVWSVRPFLSVLLFVGRGAQTPSLFGSDPFCRRRTDCYPRKCPARCLRSGGAPQRQQQRHPQQTRPRRRQQRRRRRPSRPRPRPRPRHCYVSCLCPKR